MAYCSECGNDLALGAKFCSNCGAAQVSSPLTAKAPIKKDVGERAGGRAGSKWIVYPAFAAGAAVAITGILFFIGGGTGGFLLGLIFLVAGVAAIFFAYGYRAAKPWAWALGTATGLAYILVGYLLALVFVLAGVAAVAFGTLVLSYLQRQEVKASLGRTPK